MELLKQPPAMKAPAQMFTGDAWFDVIYRSEEPSRSRANMVNFAPGARTAWHSHGPGQFMIHLALWETDEVTWLKHVTDEEYQGPCKSTRCC